MTPKAYLGVVIELFVNNNEANYVTSSVVPRPKTNITGSELQY